MQLKILQLKYENEKTLDGYFVIKQGKDQYFSSTGKVQGQGLIDYREKFSLQVQNVEFELWDYWQPIVLGTCRMDIQKVIKERKDMHIVQIRNEQTKQLIGDLMIQTLLDEEQSISQQSSIREKNQSQMASYVSGQGNSFYDNFLNEKIYVNGSMQRSTQYRSPHSPVLQMETKWGKK